jgi:hypothetical protein
VGRETIRLISFSLLLKLAFVSPGIAVGTQGFVDYVCCEDVACRIVSIFLALGMSLKTSRLWAWSLKLTPIRKREGVEKELG